MVFKIQTRLCVSNEAQQAHKESTDYQQKTKDREISFLYSASALLFLPMGADDLVAGSFGDVLLVSLYQEVKGDFKDSAVDETSGYLSAGSQGNVENKNKHNFLIAS